jgi:hypothetical protein
MWLFFVVLFFSASRYAPPVQPLRCALPNYGLGGAESACLSKRFLLDVGFFFGLGACLLRQ